MLFKLKFFKNYMCIFILLKCLVSIVSNSILTLGQNYLSNYLQQLIMLVKILTLNLSIIKISIIYKECV